MWYVECKMADGSGETLRWEGLTQEQAMSIYRQYSGWQGNTSACSAGQM